MYENCIRRKFAICSSKFKFLNLNVKFVCLCLNRYNDEKLLTESKMEYYGRCIPGGSIISNLDKGQRLRGRFNREHRDDYDAL